MNQNMLTNEDLSDLQGGALILRIPARLLQDACTQAQKCKLSLREFAEQIVECAIADRRLNDKER